MALPTRMLLASAALLLTIAAAAQTVPAPAHADDHGPMHADKAPAPPSHSVNITFGGHVTTLTVDELLKLPQVVVHVHNAHTNQDESYAGPLLADVLARAGLTSTKETEPVILHSVVIATGTDRYFVVYSGAEVEPSYSRSQVIVAIMKSGLPDTAGGNIQLINTDGAKPARWVHSLLDINVLTLAERVRQGIPPPGASNVPAVQPPQ